METQRSVNMVHLDRPAADSSRPQLQPYLCLLAARCASGAPRCATEMGDVHSCNFHTVNPTITGLSGRLLGTSDKKDV